MKRAVKFSIASLVALSLLVMLSCKKEEPLSPEDVVREFFLAVSAGDYEKAAGYYSDEKYFLEGDGVNRPPQNDLADIFPKGSIKEVNTYACTDIAPNLWRMNVLLTCELDGKQVRLAKLGVEVTESEKKLRISSPALTSGWEDPQTLCRENIKAVVEMMNKLDMADGKGKKTATKDIFLAPGSLKEIMDKYPVGYTTLQDPLCGEEFQLTKTGEHEFVLSSPSPQAYGFKNEYAFHIHTEYLSGKYGGYQGMFLQWVIYKVVTDGAENVAQKETLEAAEQLTVVADQGVNIRSGAGINYSIVVKLAKNDKLIPLGEEKIAEGVTWLLVRTLDGKEGWVCTGMGGEVWVE